MNKEKTIAKSSKEKCNNSIIVSGKRINLYCAWCNDWHDFIIE